MTWRVPFLDVSATYRELAAEIDQAVSGVMRRGHFVLGDNVRLFEAEWANHVGARFCVAVGSGLDALRLALEGLGVGASDEVIVPTNTFIATWLAVAAVGATPVPVEPIESTGNLNPKGTADAITDRTRAIIPVHLYGHPAEVDALTQLGRDCEIPVVFDAAQAHGATYAGFPVGSFGSAACWSFYPGKNLGAFGDGGAITTADAALADRLRALRNYGSTRKYNHETLGSNSRLDELQAAILRVKLPKLAEWNRRRAKIADQYTNSMRSLPIRPIEPIAGSTSSWHLFAVRSGDRTSLAAHLANVGVETLIHYPIPPHRSQAFFDRMPGAGPFPIADRIADEVLSLPMGPHLTEAQVATVCTEVAKAFRQ